MNIIDFLLEPLKDNIVNKLLNELSEYIGGDINSMVAFAIMLLCSIVIMSCKTQEFISNYFRKMLDMR